MTDEEMEAEEIQAAGKALTSAEVQYAVAGAVVRHARRRYVSAHDKAYRRRAAQFKSTHVSVEMRLWIEATRPLCPDCLGVVRPDDTRHTVTVDSGDPVPMFRCDEDWNADH